MDKKVIITAAVCGSRPTKEMNPAVPYTPQEIVDAAVECHKAGAAVAHIHVRDPKTGKPDYRIELFEEILEGIRERCDMIVNLTTSGLSIRGKDATSKRLLPVSLKPEICSLDIGSVNFLDTVFINSPQWSVTAARYMREQGVKPEIEVFDVGHLEQATDMVSRGLFYPPYYFQLCMGARWGIGASIENLVFMKDKLPKDAVWSALGIGRSQFLMITTAMELGGHIRVGFEDNIYIRQGVPAKSNAEFVEMAVNLVVSRGREPATPAEARKILGIK